MAMVLANRWDPSSFATPTRSPSLMFFHRWYRDRRYGSISSLCAEVMALYCSSRGIQGYSVHLGKGAGAGD
jgi:hypothetical protein